ncbi:MAG: hypothetical protein GXO15_05360, partial [Crenarchaeota archaeon]|nr:hypothetical protein [Thermoproteota archaeon]
LFKPDSSYHARGTEGKYVMKPPRQTATLYARLLIYTGYPRYREMLPWFMKPQWEEALYRGLVNFTWIYERYESGLKGSITQGMLLMPGNWGRLGETWRETLERGVEPVQHPLNLTEAMLQLAQIAEHCQRIPFRDPLSPSPRGAPARLERLNVSLASLTPDYIDDPRLLPKVRERWEKVRPPDVYRASITLDTPVWSRMRDWEHGVTVRVLEGIKGRAVVDVDGVNVTVELLYRLPIVLPPTGTPVPVEALVNVTFPDGSMPLHPNFPIDGSVGPDGACFGVARKKVVCLNVTLELPPPPRLDKTVYIPFRPHSAYAILPGDVVLIGGAWWYDDDTLTLQFEIYGVPPAAYRFEVLEGEAEVEVAHSTRLLVVFLDVSSAPARVRIDPLNLTLCIGCPLPRASASSSLASSPGDRSRETPASTSLAGRDSSTSSRGAAGPASSPRASTSSRSSRDPGASSSSPARLEARTALPTGRGPHASTSRSTHARSVTSSASPRRSSTSRGTAAVGYGRPASSYSSRTLRGSRTTGSGCCGGCIFLRA